MRYLSILLLTILTACGGGNTEYSVGESSLSSTAVTATPTASSNPYLLQTKVIDGYISGANVFIDFNWNLVQDEGEPSATEDLANEEYYFVESQFLYIDDYTLACASNRPRVAEVPVGATDSTRGTVTEAYTMMYFPYNSSTEKANITPFTTLFTSYIQDELTTSIDASQGCDVSANTIANNVTSRIDDVLFDLHNQYYINPVDFYEDFIASEDVEKQEIGERIVDFLGTSSKIERVVEEHYNLDMISMVSSNLVESILTNTPFVTITFDLRNESPTEQADDNFVFSRMHNINGLIANSTGQILDAEGNAIEITLENITSLAEVRISENYIAYDLIDGDTIRIAVEQVNGVENTFVDFMPTTGNGCYHSYRIKGNLRSIDDTCLSSSSYFLFEMQNGNTSFNYDMLDIMSYRDVYALTDIHTTLTDLDTTIQYRDNFVSYYYDTGDYLRYEKGRLAYYYSGDDTCDEFEGANGNRGNLVQQVKGYEGYLLCLNNM